MASFNFTYPADWAVNSFTPIQALDDHRHGRHFKSQYFVENHRGQLCGVQANYMGHICINTMRKDSDGEWHLTPIATYSLYPNDLEELLRTGRVEIPLFRDEVGVIRLIRQDEIPATQITDLLHYVESELTDADVLDDRGIQNIRMLCEKMNDMLISGEIPSEHPVRERFGKVMELVADLRRSA